MKQLLSTIPLFFCLLACKKETIPENNFSEAVYKVTFTGRWVTPQFPIPPNAHFTPIVGMVHNSTASMFATGTLASSGVESVAEDGNAFPLIAAIDSLIGLKKVVSNPLFFLTPLSSASTITLYANSNYPLFSCMSMLAPTPDWFLGLHSFNLRPGGNWITDTTVNVYSYDAGTEEGDVFKQDNPATNPQQKITLLTPANASVLANGNAVIPPIATLRFVKQ